MRGKRWIKYKERFFLVLKVYDFVCGSYSRILDIIWFFKVFIDVEGI